MERPFDYPGSQSDSFSPDPSHLTELARLTENLDDQGQGHFLHRMVCQCPTYWSDDEVTAVVRDEYPEERCHHEYDCCGQYYGRTATWVDLKEERDGYRLILVNYSFVQNV